MISSSHSWYLAMTKTYSSIIRDWLETGGELTFITRIEAMADALGISEDMLIRFIYFSPMKKGGICFGPEIQRTIVEWTYCHPDIGHNNKEYELLMIERARPE